jgi:hypothetical protein
MAVGTALKILEKEGIFPVLMKKILMLTWSEGGCGSDDSGFWQKS